MPTRKHSVNQDYFKQWSHNMAYALGLWFADGCISGGKNIFDISLHRDDEYILNAILKDMESSYPIFYEKNVARFQVSNKLGNKIRLDLPIKYHKHFRELDSKGNRLNAYIITKDYVQFCFERETGPKKEVESLIGVDTGINALASLSNGEQLGQDIKEGIARVKRCKWGSKGHKRASNALKQRISEVAKETVKKADLVVVEKLKNLCNNSKLKGRLSKSVRSDIGSWNYFYWLMRLEQQAEENRVSFRTVSPHYTSQKCSKCGYTSRTNRNGEKFKCQSCNYTDNADINAALNILERFVTGKYGSCYKPLMSRNV